MKSKLLIAAAAALVAGVSGIAILGNTSPAESKITLRYDCFPYFRKQNNGGGYRCRRVFNRHCKPDYSPNGQPVLRRIRGNTYVVEYNCSIPPD